ncbi:MAG: ScpA family protein [bacterium]|nr:ScpA family protein [bacterium]
MAVMVRTAQFEGPLELLMHLVLRHEIDVCDIPLAPLVRDFLDEVARMEALDLPSASEFLLTASTLVDLKSRKLLPEPATDGINEEADLLDGRDRLLARMLECETFRRAGAALQRLADVAALSSPRTVGPEARYLNLLPDLLADVAPSDVATACVRAMQATEPPAVDLSHMAADTLQVSDVVADLAMRLPSHRRTTFGELTQALPGRREVVVHFLALLELFKQNRVELHQDGPLGRIVVEWREQAAMPAPRVLETVT